MKPMLVSDLAARCRRLKPIEPSTYSSWQKAIKPIEELAVSDVTHTTTLDYRMQQLKPWGPLAEGTLKARLWSLQSIWNVALEAQYVSDNPWVGTGKQYTKKRRKYGQKNFDDYLAFHDDPLFLGFWYHGMRLGELAGLLPEEIHLDADIPYFDLKHNRVRRLKNDASIRQVPIHRLFMPHVERLKTDEKWLGKTWSHKLAKKVGHGAHGLRHNFITRMRRAGIEYSVAMALVGHTPLGETASYGEIYLEDMDRELQKLR